MAAKQSDERERPPGIFRQLWRTQSKWLRLWMSFQIVATFPLVAGLADGRHPERVPALVGFWVIAAAATTVLFYPWRAHYRLWRRR